MNTFKDSRQSRKKIPNYEIEPHPFEDFFPNGIKYLIIGTFPTHKRNRAFDFFYSGSRNNFWPILEKVYDVQFEQFIEEPAAIERKTLLRLKKVGITDMHVLCYRQDGKSQDEFLHPIILKNVFDVLKSLPTVETLILTSRTRIFGALGLLETLFRSNKHNWRQIPVSKAIPRLLEGKLEVNNKIYNILVPLSPSSSSKDNNIEFGELVSMYKYCLNY